MTKKQTVTVIYESPSETALRVNRHRTYIRRLANEGRIEGAIRIGTAWGIPNTWQAPILERGNPNFKKKINQSKPARKRKAKGVTSNEG